MKLHVNDLFDCDDILQDDNDSDIPSELACNPTKPQSTFVSPAPDAGTTSGCMKSAAKSGTPSPKSMSLQQAFERSARTSSVECADRHCQGIQKEAPCKYLTPKSMKLSSCC